LRKYEINSVFLPLTLLIIKNAAMEPKVSIIMGSTSDLPVMEAAAKVLNELKIHFEINALSAHRTPEEVEKFAKGAAGRGIKVIIAAAGMAAHLPGVIASMTPVPVIGVPIKASLEGLDALLAIVQMPPGIPVATVGINAAQNAGILAAQILAAGDENIMKETIKFKESLKKKIVQANEELKSVKFEFKTN
jgi:5-(carboxyamino)imidazole ribonucleotide mutase